jgi:hypothetical protein
MAKLDLQVREKQFTDPKTQRTITFDILVLVVPTILGSTEVELTARNVPFQDSLLLLLMLCC